MNEQEKVVGPDKSAGLPISSAGAVCSLGMRWPLHTIGVGFPASIGNLSAGETRPVPGGSLFRISRLDLTRPQVLKIKSEAIQRGDGGIPQYPEIALVLDPGGNAVE